MSTDVPSPLPFVGLILVLYGVAALVAVALSVVWVLALLDCVRREFPDPNTKLVWVLVIVFTHALGAILYLLVGRGQGTIPAAGSRASAPPPPPL